MGMPTKVKLVDVGPRDGLQNEKQPVDTAAKFELVHRLQAAGLREMAGTMCKSFHPGSAAKNALLYSYFLMI